MFELLWLILLFPMVWPFVAKRLWHTELTWQEVGMNVVLAVGLASVIWFSGRYVNAMDVEIWNGEVIGKSRVAVSCEHSYECRCTGSGSERSCSTCYEHDEDYDWIVRSNVGNFAISRIDRQGLHTPPRWSAVRAGDPVALEKDYMNWVKGASHSLFHEREALAAAYAGSLPDYPRVYDYHHADRVLSVGLALPDLGDWNRALADRLRKLGPQKQANVVVVITSANKGYVEALRAHWNGAKKNDVVVVIGARPSADGGRMEISWADAFSWSKTDLVNIELRDHVGSLGLLDRDTVLETIDRTIQDTFERRPMADFEYLKAEIEPPAWVIVLTILAAIPGSLMLTLVFHRNDVTIVDILRILPLMLRVASRR